MNKLIVIREKGVYPQSKIENVFDRYGLVILKEYFPPEMRTELRAAVQQRLKHAKQRNAVLKLDSYPNVDYLLGDILSVRELDHVDYLFFKRELIEALKGVLKSSEILYWGDSSIQFGEGARGFHKDNVNRHDHTHNDWIGDYGLVRCGFYFQDHANYSGGLKVRLGSQNIANHLTGKMMDIDSNFGDLVFWSMRLTHSGNNRKLKFFSRVCLHPRVEMKLPKVLTKSEHLPRISAFCAFGKPGRHQEIYAENMNKRDADYRPYFLHARKPDESKKLLQKFGVSFFQPNAYYGKNDN